MKETIKYDYEIVWRFSYFLVGLWIGITYIFYSTPREAIISGLVISLIYLMLVYFSLKIQEIK